MIKAFMVLLSAHLMADYLLQSNWMAQNKGRAVGLLSHSAVHVITSLAYLWDLSQWPVCLFIGAIHTGLDYTKNKIGPAWGPFVVDQCLHTVSLILAVAIFGKLGHFDELEVNTYYLGAQVFSGALVASVWGVYYFLFKFAPLERLKHEGYLLEKTLRVIIFCTAALSFNHAYFLIILAVALGAHLAFSVGTKTPVRAAVSITVTLFSAALATLSLGYA